MKKFLILFFLSCLLSVVIFVSVNAAQKDAELGFEIFPGVFYLTVFGDLQEGIELGGLVASEDNPQLGFWNAEHGSDYIYIFDSSSSPGFRLQFSLGGDFIYSGDDLSQENIPVSNLKIFSEWDESSNNSLLPVIAVNDSSATFDIFDSCASANSSSYSFNNNFLTGDYSVNFDENAFNYLVSTVGCVNQGVLNLGRMELDLGYASPGKYSSSLFIVMIDGF